MEDIIQIKCPFDGAILSVRNIPGIDGKSVTCPVCKKRYAFTEFKRVIKAPVQSETHTEYPNNLETATELPKMNFVIGRLTILGDGNSFPLKLGKNLIGRKSPKSQADIQIETNQGRSMSREHMLIDVRNVSSKGIVHYASLYKEKVNDTYIGEEQLFFGDSIVLQDKDLIHLPDVTLRFELIE